MVIDTLDIASLSEGTSLQKRSVMAHIVEGFNSFTFTPMHLSMNAFPTDLKLVLIYQYRRDERLS